MRSNEQFKALVYAKAEKASAENKKKRAVMMRGIATFSLIAVIGGVFLYSNNSGMKKDMYNDRDAGETVQNESRIYVAKASEENGAVLADSIYFSCDDALIGETETYNESVCEVQDFSYNEFKVSYSSENFEEQPETVSAKGTGGGLSSSEVIDIAKKLCTIDYDTHKVYYDAENEIWRIDFYTAGTVGGDQCVCLDANGNVKMIIYGE